MKMNSGVKEHLLHFDSGFSSDIVDFATNVALVVSKYMFVTTIKKQQYGYCTHCNTESPTHLPKPSDRFVAEREMCGCPAAMYMGEDYERKKHNEDTICPNCKSKCIVRYAGVGHSKLRDTAYFVYYEKSRLNSKVLVARGIYATRNYGDSYKNVITKLESEVYYTFEYKKIGKMIKPIKESWNTGYHLGFSKTVHSWSPYHPYTFSCYSRKSIKNAVENTPFAWSVWEGYDYKEMLEYFDLFSRYPVIEYLNKLGHKSIVKEKLEQGGINYSAINWKGKTIESVLKLTKEQYGIIKQQKFEITSWFLHLIKINSEKFLGLSLPEVKILSETMRGEGEIDGLKGIFGKYLSFKEAFKYCLKQHKKRSQGGYWSMDLIARDWSDYISDCKKLDMDISDMMILFPSDLHKAHQDTTKKVKYKEDIALNEKIKAALKKLSKYCFEMDGLLIRPAESTIELIEEGNALNHCVGSYGQRHAAGECTILFIRKTSEPDKSFYTMQIQQDRIIQTRSKGNHTPEENKDEAVIEFIKAFTEEKLTKKKVRSRVRVPA